MTSIRTENINGALRHRLVLIGIVVIAAALLAYGYYLQYVQYLDPCPLCITQRLFYYMGIGAAVLGLFAAASIGWQKFTGVLVMLAAVGGLITAGRQIWLQHLPPEKVPECGPGLQYWLDTKPMFQTLQLLFKGDGNCAEVVWSFLGLSIAGWSALWFLTMLLTGIWIFTCRPRLQRSPRATSETVTT